MADRAHDGGAPRQEAPSNVVSDSQHCTRTLEDLDRLAAHIAGTFVVVVEVTAGRYRRRCFLTAKSAENAARSATDRGENATVYLAELKPLWKIATRNPTSGYLPASGRRGIA